MEVSILQSCVFGIVAILAFLCIKYFRLIVGSFATLPRDLRGVKCIVSLQLACLLNKWRNRTVFEVFDIIARENSEKVCFYFEDEAWTFRQVQEYSNKIANYFYSQGYRKGDKIAVIMDNRPEYVATWLGLSRIGVIASLINTNLRQETLKHALQVLPHKGIIYEDDVATEGLDQVIGLGYKPENLYCSRKSSSRLSSGDINSVVDLEAMLKQTSAKFKSTEKINFDDPLYYSFTSGTTGFPKAAIIKHSRFFLAGLSAVHAFNVRHSDIQYTPLPLYHTTAGMLGLGPALFNGTSIVLRKKFSASQFWKDCIHYKVTVAQYIGEALRYLYSQPPSKLDRQHSVQKLFGLGLRKDLWVDFVDRFGVTDINEFYGSTEGNCNIVNIYNVLLYHKLDATPGACGFTPRWAYPFLPYKLVKVSEDGEIIRDSKTGRVVVCDINEPGELIGKIYPKDPLRNFEGYSDKTATEKKIIRNVFSKGDSYFRSGDLLMMDELGYFYFKDRCGDTFRWKSENVSTQQVESVLSKICALKDVAVYGVKIPFTEGRAGMAAIADPDYKIDLTQFATEVNKRLPGYSRPLFLRIKSELEYTSTHKLKKTDLQKEGFDIRLINDPIYFLSESHYVPLTDHIFNSIMNGKVRL